jgi:two-component system chemotaxis sensor kinase CheA
MIRNALDHGLESAENRSKAGKNPTGRLTLRAFHAAGQVVLQVEDDGAGLSRDQILATARRKGLIPEGRNLSDDEIYQLIFEPGFSTAKQVTELSGRGMGMDIVRKNIQALRGNVTVQSRPGAGATITIRLPLTMAVIQGLYVEAAGETYILPLESVLECLNFPTSERSQTTNVINLRGEPLPYIRLRDMLHATTPPPERENVVVIHFAGGSAGIAVDALRGQGQTVIKPLDKIFADIPCVSGSAVTGEGRVALILDVVGLIHRAQRLCDSSPHSTSV